MDWNSQNIEQTIESLKRLKNQPLPGEIFDAVCNHTIGLPIELIPLTRSGEILLFRRDISDKYFSGLWHGPGTIQLPGQTVENCFSRLLERDELRNIPHTKPEFLFIRSIEHGRGTGESPRGQEESRVYLTWISADAEKNEGKLFPIQNIPEDTVSHHKIHIFPAVASLYKENKLPGQRSWQGL